MGLLDGGLTPVVAGAFKWLLLDGTLHRRSLTDNGKGGLVNTSDVGEPVKVMVDPADELMRAADDFNVRDVSILMLADGVDWPTLEDELTIATGQHAGRYHLLPPIRLDTAQTHYVIRGRKV